MICKQFNCHSIITGLRVNDFSKLFMLINLHWRDKVKVSLWLSLIACKAFNCNRSVQDFLAALSGLMIFTDH